MDVIFLLPDSDVEANATGNSHPTAANATKEEEKKEENGNGEPVEPEEQQKAAGGGGLKEKSVLQTKLNKLAIQIGYAGRW